MRVRRHWPLLQFSMMAIIALLLIGFGDIFPIHTLETITLQPTDDATLSVKGPQNNYNLPILEVDDSSRKHILLKFRVAGLLQRPVMSAVLTLHNQDASPHGGDLFLAAHNNWSEKSVTWDSSPHKTGNIIHAVTRVKVGHDYSWDVTPLIQTDGVYSLRIESPSANGADYSSKEGSKPPQLVVTIANGGPIHNKAPSVQAGSKQIISFPSQAQLAGSVTDDGLPNGSLTYQWSTVSGPSAVTFDHVTSLTTTASFHSVGSYVLQLTSSDGELTGSDEINVLVNSESTPPDNLTFPIRGAFYYPWFPETWTVNGSHVFYQPGPGYYDSSDQDVVDSHIRSLGIGKIDVGIVSWWGPHTHNEAERVPLLFNRTHALGSDLKWGLYYEKEGVGNPSVTELKSDLAYLKSRYTQSQAFAHVDDRPVIFVYNADDRNCSIVDKWLQATEGNWYVVLKVFPNYQACPQQPDSWHQYAPAVPVDHQTGSSLSISPGFFRADESNARLERHLSRWKQQVKEMVASKENWQLITTFNEWGEGTAIEEATAWSTDYLDALATDGQEDTGDSIITIRLSPMNTTLKTGEPRSFTATVEGTTNTGVSWTTSGGTISGSGRTVSYTAPNQEGTFTLTAISAADASKTVTASIQVSPPNTPGFVTFATAGDFGGKDDRAGKVMNDLKSRDIDAFLLLGDISYNEITPESSWCEWVHSYVGHNFPFEIVAGNHEEDGSGGAHIRHFADCMPDHMNSDHGPGGYSVNYSFDLGPLTVIATSPDLTIDNVDYTYRAGSAERNWLENSILSAKQEGDWVAVGMHKNCITIGNKSCEIGEELAQLLIDEGVDIVLQGHEHDYQRSHSLSKVQADRFPSGAIADNGSDDRYVRGSGTVFVIVGTAGRSLTTCSHSDSEFRYFANHLCREEGNSKGYVLINANDSRMDINFISVVGTNQDTFSIYSIDSLTSPIKQSK